MTNDPHRLFCPHADCGEVLTIVDERKVHKEHPMTCTKVKEILFVNLLSIVYIILV